MKSAWDYVYVQAVVAGTLIVGCHSGAKAGSSGEAGTAYAQVAPGKSGGATYLNGKAVSSSTTTATITDPTLNSMPAATLTIPAGWKMQGMMLTSPCTQIPAAVFRAYSPDGLMQMRFEPAMGWVWGSRMGTGT